MSSFLEAFREEIEKSKANVFAIAQYRSGSLETRQLVQTSPCQNVYSVAKAYVVTAVGLAVDRGLLSTSETVTQILGEDCPQNYPRAWDRVTVEMLLLHQVPLPRNFLDIDVHDSREFGQDYLSYILKNAVETEDGVYPPCYTDAAFYLLSRIVEKRTGMGLDDFLWKHLLYPTNCREAAWSHCPQGHVIGATGLYIRAEELVKLGSIYLQGGLWEDTRILSENWVNTVLQKGYELKPQAEGHAFCKGGMRGQMLMLLPERDWVVAYQGCGDYHFVDFITAYEEKLDG